MGGHSKNVSTTNQIIIDFLPLQMELRLDLVFAVSPCCGIVIPKLVSWIACQTDKFMSLRLLLCGSYSELASFRKENLAP